MEVTRDSSNNLSNTSESAVQGLCVDGLAGLTTANSVEQEAETDEPVDSPMIKRTESYQHKPEPYVLKRFRRSQNTIVLADLEKKITEIGASLQKRKPDFNKSRDSDDSQGDPSPLRYFRTREKGELTKAKDQTSISALIMKSELRGKRVFPCFLDSQIYKTPADLDLSKKLKQVKDRDYEDDTSSEDLEKGKTHAFRALNNAIRDFGQHYNKSKRHQVKEFKVDNSQFRTKVEEKPKTIQPNCKEITEHSVTGTKETGNQSNNS